MKLDKLDKEEKELYDSIERGEWKTVNNFAAEKRKAQMMARNTLRKNKIMNIRISETDLDSLKSKAFDEGLPYQTLVTSVLHKFLTGKFIEKQVHANAHGK
jgi:predicted DNA binding CopG/RHH family protein